MVSCAGSCGDHAADVAASGMEAAANEASGSDAAKAQPKDDKSQSADEEGEDPSTLQLAWEVLEVSRMIYERCVCVFLFIAVFGKIG